MNSSLPFCIVFLFFICSCIKFSLADNVNLQDTCPTATPPGKEQTVFINGFACKNPANISGSDFKTSKLNQAGNTDNIFRSSLSIVTAADFPGLNTLGLSIARTDLDVDGLVMPHSHPRASEMFFVSKGIVIAGFLDTQKKLFQKTLKEGDVFVFPQGLLHFCFNNGYELATIFSILNSQNPGVVAITDATFQLDSDVLIDKVVRRLISLTGSDSKVNHS